MSIRTASLGAASLFAMVAVAGTAFADGMPSRGRIASEAPAPRTCSTSANVGLTTDYVFRGISQTLEGAAVQGGVDFTCGGFYAGVWASSVSEIFTGSDTEIDLYAGYKITTGRLTWDLGLIYYAYPGNEVFDFDGDYIELKGGVSAEVVRNLTVGGTLFYSPDVNGESVTTVEGTAAYGLPKLGLFSPTLSGTVGFVNPEDSDEYTYWNVGVTFGYDKWSLDVRYWDTDIDGGCGGICDDRVVGTVKYTF